MEVEINNVNARGFVTRSRKMVIPMDGIAARIGNERLADLMAGDVVSYEASPLNRFTMRKR